MFSLTFTLVRDPQSFDACRNKIFHGGDQCFVKFASVKMSRLESNYRQSPYQYLGIFRGQPTKAVTQNAFL